MVCNMKIYNLLEIRNDKANLYLLMQAELLVIFTSKHKEQQRGNYSCPFPGTGVAPGVPE